MDRRLIFLVVLATLYPAMADRIDIPIPCQSLQDCVDFSHALQGAECMKGFCACKNGNEMKNCSSAEITHQATRSAGSPMFRECKLNQHCTFNNSICNITMGQCECQKNYVFSSSKKACLKKAESIHFPCVDDKQCLAYLPNTTCQSGKCNCIPGYHYTRNACYKKIDFANPCTRSEECEHVVGAVCNDRSLCTCPAETVINSNWSKCLPVAREFLENCVEDVQCTMTFSDSACIDRVCQCQYQYHFEQEMNRCYINKGLDENCGNSYECYQEENENVTTKAVTCMENVCICAEDFSQDQNRCVNEGTPLFESLLLIIAMLAFSKRV